MTSVPRLDLPPDEQRALERAGRKVARAEQALDEARRERRALVRQVLAERGDQYGVLAAVARAAGMTLEAARLERKRLEDER